MSGLSRRALIGGGIVGASALATGGALLLRSEGPSSTSPSLPGGGPAITLMGFIGGEKERFVESERIRGLLRQRGLSLEARRAGSVEMVRERSLLDQHPQFLWPASSVFVDLARQNGVNVRRDQVILNSPIVLFSWEPIASGLIAGGFARQIGPRRYEVDMARLIGAIVDGKSWSDLGISGLFGRARIIATDPNRSNSGFMFVGLVANVLSGDVTDRAGAERVAEGVRTVFRRMGFMSASSGRIFEDYLAGGPSVQPIVVGYENQLVEWALEDRERWRRVQADAAQRPVVLYPLPTVFSSHPLIAVDPAAGRLIDALLAPEAQQVAWTEHGFRGPIGTAGTVDALFEEFVRPSIESVSPMPSANVMLDLVGRIAVG